MSGGPHPPRSSDRAFDLRVRHEALRRDVEEWGRLHGAAGLKATAIWAWAMSIVAGITLFTALGAFVPASGPGLRRLYSWVSGSTWRTTVALFTVVALAEAGLRLRRRFRYQYGSFEVGVGCALVAFTLANPASDARVETVALLGGFFVVVRGIDNREAGIAEKVSRMEMAIPDLAERERRITTELKAIVRATLELHREEAQALQSDPVGGQPRTPSSQRAGDAPPNSARPRAKVHGQHGFA